MRFIHDAASPAYLHHQLPDERTDLLDDLELRILPLHDPSNVAAIIVEPIAGSAGWYLPPKGYLQRLRQLCDKHGILLIFDEVITGFGRLGVNFGADYFGVVPDMLNFAKAITNGVIPLGGAVCRQHLYDAVMGANEKNPGHAIEFAHGYTYSGHPVACAAAVATLTLFKQENLFQRATDMGQVLGDAMHSALKGLPNVMGIRTLGLAGAVELQGIASLPGKRAYDIFLHCFHHGLMVRPAGDVLVLAPPFIVDKGQVEKMVGLLASAIQKHA
jgi:beta-alanine--pyruvate transaminase